jgi:pimeloyl-ACP methyl ester carboxylesterase
MPKERIYNRRTFLGSALMSLGAAELTMLGLSDEQAITQESVSISPGRPISNGAFDQLKQIDAGELNVGYIDAGPADGPVIILLHGWPYDIHSFEDVTPLLTAVGYRVIVPYQRGYGSTRFLSNKTFRNGQQSVFALDTIKLMDALKIKTAIVAGFDWGARTATIIAALWPDRCTALVSVSGYLIVNLKANQQPLSPVAERAWWYQYYFATERGRIGYEKNRYEFAKLIWQIASPKWNFDDDTFNRSAAAFDNPDHVSIVIHNYRWRLSLAPGDPQLDEMERRLNARPVITVPSITIGSDFDGSAADGRSYAKLFTGKYSHRILKGIGHNVPQEAPRDFASAILEVAGIVLRNEKIGVDGGSTM